MVRTTVTSIVEEPVTQIVVVVDLPVAFVPDLVSVNSILIFPLALAVLLMINAPTSMMRLLVPLKNALTPSVLLLLPPPQPNAVPPLESVMLLRSVMELTKLALLMALPKKELCAELKSTSVIKTISVMVLAKSVLTLLNQQDFLAVIPEMVVDAILKTNVMEHPQRVLMSSPPLLPS